MLRSKVGTPSILRPARESLQAVSEVSADELPSACVLIIEKVSLKLLDDYVKIFD